MLNRLPFHQALSDETLCGGHPLQLKGGGFPQKTGHKDTQGSV